MEILGIKKIKKPGNFFLYQNIRKKNELVYLLKFSNKQKTLLGYGKIFFIKNIHTQIQKYKFSNIRKN